MSVMDLPLAVHASRAEASTPWSQTLQRHGFLPSGISSRSFHLDQGQVQDLRPFAITSPTLRNSLWGSSF